MQDTPDQDGTATLRFLRRLVTVLTTTMIAGFLVLIVLFVTRFPGTRTPLPDAITLPDGSQPTAFTQSATWYAVVTADNEILIYNRATGKLAQRIEISLQP